MIDLIGWFGNICFVIGAILLGRRNSYGWHYQLLGNFFYVLFSILLGKEGISLGFLSLLLIGTNIYGLYQWRIKNG